MINWKVRLKNKTFWVAMIPMVLLLISQVLGIFGINFDYTELGEKLIAIVGSVFAILGIMGVIVDPTTAGVQDSANAMTYDEPK